MPKKKKRPSEMTNEELAHFVFPKKVVEEAKRLAHQNDAPETPKKRQSKSS